MRLITIPMSHYCEKARWGLVHAGVDYVEDAHLQVFHYLAVRRHSSRGMVPVLITDTAAVADSTAILHFLDARLPDASRLYTEQQRGEVESLEEYFDEQLGVETRRWVYFHWMNLPAREVLKTAAHGVPAWQRLIAPLLFPLLRFFLNRKLAISSANVDRGVQLIVGIFDEVAARLGDGRPYLCGARFTAADLSFACMAAPVILPPEYGIPLPTPDQAPQPAREDIRRFRAHPAGQFALRLFAERRGKAADWRV
ncbi:MAG TPA: glutathione S-transferase [Nevskia sp.]|nr:glutathione S-transferase [Nevskia sp.]